MCVTVCVAIDLCVLSESGMAGMKQVNITSYVPLKVLKNVYVEENNDIMLIIYM